MSNPGKITPSDGLPASSQPPPTRLSLGQPAALFVCRLEEPRRNLVHTTAVLAAILFLSILSSLQAGATYSYPHNGATPCSGKGRRQWQSCLSVGSFQSLQGWTNTSRTQPRFLFSVAHVTKPISGISSECSTFFMEDSFYTHQSFIARLYIVYI